MCTKFSNLLTSGKLATLLVIGDSLTYGWEVRRGGGYVEQLEKLLKKAYSKCTLVLDKRGYPGATIDKGARVATHAFEDSSSNLLIIQFGLNDAFISGALGIDAFEATLRSLVAMYFEKFPAGEIIFAPPPLIASEEEQDMAVIIEPYREVYRRVASDMRTEFHTILSAPISEAYEQAKTTGQSDLWLQDRVHPSEQGYRLIAEALFYSITSARAAD